MTRRARRQVRLWIGLATAVLTLVIALVIGQSVFHFHRRSARSAALNQLLVAASQAERAHRLDEALVALEAALTLAEADATVVDVEDLHARRDRLATKEAEEQLRVLEGPNDDPGRAVGRALTLRLRATRDPALLSLASRVEAVLAHLQLQRVEHEAAAALAAEDAGRLADALELASQVHEHATEIATEPRAHWQTAATDIAARVIGRAGVIIEPVRGQYTLGSNQDYDSLLQPLFATGLRNAGYLTKTRRTAWDQLWASNAPYRLTSTILERVAGTYLSSLNRLSRIDLKVALSRNGSPIWSGEPTATTSVPVPGIGAYQASRVAVSDGRNIELERLLYENARLNLLDRLGTFLRNLPSLAPTTVPTTAGS